MDIDTRLLRAFVAIAEDRHITRAAERLVLAQPALSKQLKRLERQLGAELVHRSNRGITLTAAGEALLPAAQDVLAAWETAQRRARSAARAGLPELRVGFIASAAGEHTPQISARFATLRPGWRLELVQVDWADPTAGLAAGTTDAALLRLPIPDDTDLRIQPLYEEPMCVAMSSAHPLADRKRLTMADLLDEPFIATRGPADWRDWWLATGHRNGRPPIIATLVGTPDEWLQAILNGVGISLAFEAATRFYAPPGITYKPLDGLPPSTVAAAHRHDTRNPAVDDFIRASLQAVCQHDHAARKEPKNGG